MQVINYHKQVMPHKESKKSIQILPKIHSKIPFTSAKIHPHPPQKSTLDAYFFLKTQLFISLFFFFFW